MKYGPREGGESWSLKNLSVRLLKRLPFADVVKREQHAEGRDEISLPNSKSPSDGCLKLAPQSQQSAVKVIVNLQLDLWW